MIDRMEAPPSGRLCVWCNQPVPAGSRRDAKFCDVVCRKRSWRFTSAALACGEAPATRDAPVTFAYADPPYPGKIDYYTDQPRNDWPDQPDGSGEIDHRELIERLTGEYPAGWALSTSAAALRDVLPLCPPDVRVASWHRRVRHTRARHPLSSWEPLIVWRGRPYSTTASQTVLDRLVYEGRYKSYPGALVGMKPPEFAIWMFRQLNASRGDDVHDLFPGSGAIGRAWAIYGLGDRTTEPRAGICSSRNGSAGAPCYGSAG